MSHLQTSVERRRFPEENIVASGAVHVAYGSYAFEPYYIHSGCPVGKKTDKAHFRTLAENVERHKSSAQLQVRHLAASGAYIADGVESGAVDVACGKMVQQIPGGAYAQLFFKKFGASGAYSFDEFGFEAPQG